MMAHLRIVVDLEHVMKLHDTQVIQRFVNVVFPQGMSEKRQPHVVSGQPIKPNDRQVSPFMTVVGCVIGTGRP